MTFSSPFIEFYPFTFRAFKAPLSSAGTFRLELEAMVDMKSVRHPPHSPLFLPSARLDLSGG